MTIKLYSWPQSSGTRIAWALEELGLAYDYVQLDASKQEHRAAAHLAIHPHGKVPALVDGGVSLFETGAILIHLGETYGVERKLWPPRSGQAHADALSWTVWAAAELGPHMMQYAYHALASPFSYKVADQSRAAGEYERSQFERGLQVLDARLDGRQYLLGDFTLVDVAIASWLRFGAYLGIGFDAWPRIGDWLARCTARPALARAR
jgi:glutathione S-transferase